MATIKYKGEEYEYNDTLLGESPEAYGFQKRLAKFGKGDALEMFEIFERLFDGHDEEYVARLGSTSALSELFAAIMSAQEGDAKNSKS